MGNKRNVKLKTIGDASSFLSKVINQVYRDELETSKASKLGYLVNILIGSIKDSEIERRLEILEEKVSEPK